MSYRISQKMLQEIGKNIQKTRKQQKKKQLDIAVDAGIEYSYYTKIERGEAKNPSLSKMYAIFRSLGVKSTDILPF